MAYTKTTWVNNQAPAINADNLNKIEDGIYNSVRYADEQILTDAQKAQARENIEAQNGTIVSEILNTKGWYRVVTGSSRSGGILTVQNSYNNWRPSSLKLLVTLSDDGSSLKCIEYTNYIGSAITNVRIVSNELNQYYIDVYYDVNGLNLVAIDFISTGLLEAKVQVPVYIGANDTLPSGENLMATMEYLNPPMQLGVEYRTTERYMGKPVYVKLIDCGNLPDGTIKDVTHGITNLGFIVGAQAIASDGTSGFNGHSYMPSFYDGSFTARWTNYLAGVDSNNISIFCGGGLAGCPVYVTFKYTKTTD